jgi:hypothetical protein
MLRAVCLLAAAACLAAPALAAQRTTVTRETTTIVSIPAADYERWQRMGYSTQDIFYAYNAAAASNRKVDEIFAMRKAGRSWDQIAGETRVTTRQIYGVPTSVVAGERIEITRAQDTDRAMPMDRRAGMTGRYTDSGVIGGISPYGVHERKLPDAFYRNTYRLTPRDYKRFRAAGFSQDEVYMIANAANATGLDPQHFMDAIYRGQYARGISIHFGISPNRLTRVRPEWRTPEWVAATGEPAITEERLDVIY